jgi:xylulokinase
MGLTCFANGSLARERIRDEHGMTWLQFSEALDATPPGNDGRLLLPWFAPEITPHVPVPSPHRFGLARGDGPSDVRAVVEAQQMAMALHSRWIASRVDRIYATGGASVNRAILQVMADVFGADVYSSEVTNTAALGAALRARHARLVQTGEPADWDDIIRGLAEPDSHSRVQPDPRRHAMYQRLIGVYAACEAVALGRGPDPQPAIDAFRAG